MRGPIVAMVNTDYFPDDSFDNFDNFYNLDSIENLDDAAPYRTFGLGQSSRLRAGVSIRREHR